MARPPIQNGNGNENGNENRDGDGAPAPAPTAATEAAPAPAETATQIPASTPTNMRPRRGSSLPWMLTGVLLVLVAAGASYMTWPLWKDRAPGYLRLVLDPVMQAGRDIGLQREVAAMDKRLGEVESQIMLMRKSVAKAIAAGDGGSAAQTAQTAQTAKLASRLDGLETSLAALGRRARPDARLTRRTDRRIARLGAKVAKLAARRDGFGTAALAKRFGALGRRLDALESRIRAVAARPASPKIAAPAAAPDPGPASAAAADLDALRQGSDAKFAALERQNEMVSAALADMTGKLGALQSRLDRQATAAPGAAGNGGLLLALGQLREALRGPGSYKVELEALRLSAAGDALVQKSVAALAPDSGAGIPARAALLRRFPALATRVAQAALAPDGDSWLDQTLARLSRVVLVRRTGSADPASATGLLASAEALAASGDLAGAAAALGRLTGAPAKAAAEWLSDARRRIAADKVLSALSAHAIAALKPGG